MMAIVRIIYDDDVAYLDNKPAGDKFIFVFDFELRYFFSELWFILNLFQLRDIAKWIEQCLYYVVKQWN